MKSNGFLNTTQYIVPTYGFPRYVYFEDNYGTGYSLDNWLSNLQYLGEISSGSWYNSMINSYYAPSPTTNSARLKNYSVNGRKLYAVCRLDGPSALHAISLFEKAITAEQSLIK